MTDSFSLRSLGVEQEFMVDPDGHIIPGSKVLWYTGKLAFDFLTDSEKFKHQPLQLLAQGNELIDGLNQILSDLPSDVLKLDNYDATVEQHLSAFCSYAREERGFHSPFSLILFLDLMSLDLQNKAFFCTETYAVATLITLNDLPLALVEPDIDLICYITQQATQAVAEVRKESPLYLRATLFTERANNKRHRYNRVDKQKAIDLYRKNKDAKGYMGPGQASYTLHEMKDFAGYARSTILTWLTGLK